MSQDIVILENAVQELQAKVAIGVISAAAAAVWIMRLRRIYERLNRIQEKISGWR